MLSSSMFYQVNSFVGAFHDAVILYALALNETLEAGQSASNGTEITKRMWNRTFEGRHCPQVFPIKVYTYDEGNRLELELRML